MEEIAAAAGVSRMTLHRRGLTREGLLDALREALVAEEREALWPALDRDAAADASGSVLALSALCEVSERNLAVLPALADDVRDEVWHEPGDGALTRGEFTAPFRRLLEDGAADGSLAPPGDLDELATVLYNQVSWTYRHLRTGHRWTPERARSARRRARRAGRLGLMAVAASRGRIDRRGIGMLAFGHLSVDLVQGAVPPLLPFLVRERGYSYAAAGSLLLFSSLGSSLLQPLLGAIADRVRASWLMPAGPALAAVGIGLVATTDSYLATGAALGVASIGVAMYHPEAVRFADYVSRASGRRGAGMSMFAVGGISGWALGPAIVTPAVLIFGLPGIALVAIIPLVAALLLWTQLELRRAVPARARLVGERAGRQGGAAREPLGGLQARRRVPPRCARACSSGCRPTCRCTSGRCCTRARAARTSSARCCSRRVRSARSSAGASPIATASAGSSSGRSRSRRRSSPALPLVSAPGVFILMGLIGLTMEANFYPLALAAQNAVPRHVGFSAGVTLGVSIGIGAGHLGAARRARRLPGPAGGGGRDRGDRDPGLRASR